MVILFDQYNLPDDIYDIIFATEQQKEVAKLLIKMIKDHNGEITKTEMSLFATRLHEGTLIIQSSNSNVLKIGPMAKKEPEMSYNKRQFYDRILTPMKAMGLIDYDLYKKTYKISDKFHKNLSKIGLMWLMELREKRIN